jgi:hypothetical protein
MKKSMIIIFLALAAFGCAASRQGGGASSASGERTVKSQDGSFEGEMYGVPASNSKFAKLRIGMKQREVEGLIGRPDDEDSHITGKAFIPFFFGGDTHRLEAFYKGEGQLTYSPEHWGGNPNVLIRIAVDPSESGRAH